MYGPSDGRQQQAECVGVTDAEGRGEVEGCCQATCARPTHSTHKHVPMLGCLCVCLAHSLHLQEGESLAEQAAKMSLSSLTHNSSGSDSTRSPLDNAAQKHARASAAAATAAAAVKAETDPAGTAATRAAEAAAAAEGGGSTKPSKGSGSAAGGGSASPGECEIGPPAGPADPEAAASPGEALEARLGRYLRHMHIHTVVTAMCIVNTLTPRQMATLSVGE
jgi:hypothetical protein